MGYVGGMVYGNMGYVGVMLYGNIGKPPYVVGYVLTVCMVRGKTQYIYGIVRLFAVWYHGTMSWLYYVANCFRTNIICNQLIYRPL